MRKYRNAIKGISGGARRGAAEREVSVCDASGCMDKWYIRYYIEIPYTKQERKMARGEVERKKEKSRVALVDGSFFFT